MTLEEVDPECHQAVPRRAAPPSSPAAGGIEDISWDEIDKVRYYILGPVMFLGVRAAVYPSSLVKTRLQVQSKARPVYSGTFDAFRKILRQEGPRGLYKGFGASTANVLTGNLYISVYEKSRKMFRDHTTVWTACGLVVGDVGGSDKMWMDGDRLARSCPTLPAARSRPSSRRRSSCRSTLCRSA